jgi:hypothetical protein
MITWLSDVAHLLSESAWSAAIPWETTASPHMPRTKRLSIVGNGRAPNSGACSPGAPNRRKAVRAIAFPVSFTNRRSHRYALMFPSTVVPAIASNDAWSPTMSPSTVDRWIDIVDPSAALVAAVRIAVRGDEIALLELDRGQNVAGRRQREDEVRHCHRRRAPEGEQPADVEWMAHPFGPTPSSRRATSRRASSCCARRWATPAKPDVHRNGAAGRVPLRGAPESRRRTGCRAQRGRASAKGDRRARRVLSSRRRRDALREERRRAHRVSGRGQFRPRPGVRARVSHVEYAWEEPSFSRFLRRLASFSRLILVDRRGTGLSDRVADLPSLEQRMDDVRAVMDAAGSERAALFGISEGGPPTARGIDPQPVRLLGAARLPCRW